MATPEQLAQIDASFKTATDRIQVLEQKLQEAVDAQRAAQAAPPAVATGKCNIKPPNYTDPDKDDWATFKRQFMELPLANGWSQLQAKAALLNALKGDAAASAASQTDIWNKPTLAECLEDLETMFMPRSSSQIAKAMVDVAYQGAKETLMHWHTRLQVLYRKGYPDSTDQSVLIRRFIVGIRSEKIRNQALRADPMDYRAALLAAQNELAVQQVNKTATTGVSGPMADSGVEPMDIDAIVSRKRGRVAALQDSGNEGDHQEAIEDIIATLNLMKKAENGCWFCGNTKHMKKDCILFKKAKGNILQNQDKKKRENTRGTGNKRMQLKKMIAAMDKEEAEDTADSSDSEDEEAVTDSEGEEDF